MKALAKTSSLAKVDRPKPPPGAITYPDSDRYKFGFGVASQSSGRIYKISFDCAPGALYWTCSCMGNTRYGQCKHLTSCGLRGRGSGKQLDFAKKHGFIR